MGNDIGWDRALQEVGGGSHIFAGNITLARSACQSVLTKSAGGFSSTKKAWNDGTVHVDHLAF